MGIRQASLYNHFATKNDILVALLEGTVEPALEFEAQLDDALAPEVRLCALAWFDAAQLCGGRWNIGALYHLPELRSDAFVDFRRNRRRLRLRYLQLAARLVGAADPRADLPFRLVESIISIRADSGDVDAGLPEALATASLTVLGVDDIGACVHSARTLVAGSSADARDGARTRLAR